MIKSTGTVFSVSIFLLVLFTVVYGLTACGSTGKMVSFISLDKAKSIIIGKTEPLTAPTENKDLIWNSDKPDIVSVNENGVITGKALGTATITVTSVDGSKKANCVVSVRLISMIPIQGGTFIMGSLDDEHGSFYDEHPPHEVTVDSFQMGEYKITQKQWEFVMGTKPSEFKGDSLPVEQISWYEALIFCNKLSMIEGLTPAYSIGGSTNPEDWGKLPVHPKSDPRWDAVQIVDGTTGYRLPTEAQWEYACRAGSTTPFHTGHDISTDEANFNGRYPYAKKEDPKGSLRNKTTEVGMFEPNAWGLYDMHGNVFEWCWDWYETYPGADRKSVSDKLRVVRAGAWNSKAHMLRAAARGQSVPTFPNNNLGLRVVSP